MKRAKKRARRPAAVSAPESGLLARQVGEALKAQGMTLVTAESCTGGGVAQAVTRISGSSDWFDRGFVTYSNESKEEMLGVSPETLEQYGAVSEQTVREMVDGALQYSRAQIALSVSGIAGPTGGTPEKPVGTVWFAWGTNKSVHAVCHHLPGDRDAVRAKSVQIALQGVINLLNGITKIA
ncbi:MAG: CinA family protein [Gammaproteobacteria bacterium]|nr:CinA family protein [Gammaproteobacteria bacterium]MBU1665579.1 CinA family protein [Gammaproteobacteria bacterium]MBU1970039.1 CinA family protein [Gammaproteobacteria bacterium]